jgi:hypothetical protein
MDFSFGKIAFATLYINPEKIATIPMMAILTGALLFTAPPVRPFGLTPPHKGGGKGVAAPLNNNLSNQHTCQRGIFALQ